ncbi:Pex12 amino terminal region-domain-containing protein [Pisolithus croceorrhizus]|nr:Pex12 amino terminal region-domain-containing protein [Pisolithus croceorrhizus]KAI6163055.1 Pex12 amino terminal region-domain-containing protein [Pisolithus thermaeus]
MTLSRTPPSSPWPTRWQEAWEAAQPALSLIRGSLNADGIPTPRPLRVNQIDSELLDQQLVHLLCEPLQRALGIANAALRTRFEPELTLLVQVVLYKFSVWNLGATYGAKLQGLAYGAPTGTKGPLAPSGLRRRTLIIHGAFTIFLPYCYNRLRAYALSRAWPDAPSSDKRRIAWRTLSRLETTHALLALFNTLVFLWNGRYRSLTDRFLRLSLVSTRGKVTREVSYEFMNRQMVWHAFTEFLLFLLPLISPRVLQRRFGKVVSRLVLSVLPSSNDRKPWQRKRGKYEALPSGQCAICADNASHTLDLGYSANTPTSLAPYSSSQESITDPASVDEIPAFPIHTPYITSCGHLYCYYCISERMMRTVDEGSEVGWECLRCAEHVRSADRWEAEVSVVRDSSSESDYEFSSEFGTTDLSGSASSYPGSLTE